jgi:hypothetical protein
VYDELTDNAMWIGGWVLEEDENGEPVDFPTYFTATGTAYPGEDEEENVFGNEDNPIPIDVYEEMCELDIWTGGWVVYPNGTTEEFPENEGGTSGSGSGSGCGCGCGNNDAGCGCGCGEDEGGSGCRGDGVSAGSITLYTHSVTLATLLLSWTAGTITRDCTSELSLEFVTTGSSYVFDEISLSSEARWIGLYGVIYNYTLSFKYYDNGVWKEVQEVGNGELTIPTEYQNS